MINSPSKGNEGLMENFGKMARRFSLALLLSGATAPFSVAHASPPEIQETSSSEAMKKANALLGLEFECYATGSMTPEQAAVAQFAKATGLSVSEVEAGYVTVIVKLQEGEFAETIAKMAKKVTEKPAPATQAQPKAKLTPQQQELLDSYLALEPGQRLVFDKKEYGLVVKEPAVRFVIDKDAVTKESFPFLDQVAGFILATDVKKLRVECHTDNHGDKEKQLKRTQDCAESVKAYLVGKGIDPSRLIAEGFGDTRPVAPNLTKRGRELNRRVNFFVIESAKPDPISED